MFRRRSKVDVPRSIERRRLPASSAAVHGGVAASVGKTRGASNFARTLRYAVVDTRTKSRQLVAPKQPDARVSERRVRCGRGNHRASLDHWTGSLFAFERSNRLNRAEIFRRLLPLGPVRYPLPPQLKLTRRSRSTHLPPPAAHSTRPSSRTPYLTTTPSTTRPPLSPRCEPQLPTFLPRTTLLPPPPPLPPPPSTTPFYPPLPHAHRSL